MAYIRRRTLKDGKTPAYLAVWKEHPSGPEQTKTFARKADAERHLVDVQHRLLTGTYAAPQLGRTPFSDVADRYLLLPVTFVQDGRDVIGEDGDVGTTDDVNVAVGGVV